MRLARWIARPAPGRARSIRSRRRPAPAGVRRADRADHRLLARCRRTSCTFDNIVGILLATSVNGVLALGVTFVIITGGIDLSIGTVMTLSAVMTGVVITNMGLPLPVGIAAGILTGGAGRARQRHPDRALPDPAVHRDAGHAEHRQGPGARDLGPHADLLQRHARVQRGGHGLADRLASSRASTSRTSCWSCSGRRSIASFILSRTILGRYTFALGSNEEAARLSGVNVVSWKTAVYIALRPVRGSRRRRDRAPGSTRPSRRWARATSSMRSRRPSSAARR